MVICGSFTLGRLVDFISAHFLFNGTLLFSEDFFIKVFRTSVFINIVFLKEKIIFYIVSVVSIRIYSLVTICNLEKLFLKCLENEWA